MVVDIEHNPKLKDSCILSFCEVNGSIRCIKLNRSVKVYKGVGLHSVIKSLYSIEFVCMYTQICTLSG